MTIPDTNKQIRIGIAVYAAIMIVIAFFAKGTGDEGDSILHYLYAKTAWQYKGHFFDQWAKPLYVLAAFPFSQFGLIGVKLMNVLCNCASIWLVYRTAISLRFRWPWIPPLLLVAMPMFNYLGLSGLTEPLSACLLLAGVYLLIRGKWIIAVLLLSFLPFVRAEGLVILIAVFGYLVIIKKYQFIPLLATGHMFYGILGSFYHKDIFWVVTKMPNTAWASAYGNGKWLHFAERMPEIAGSALTVVFFMGLLWGFILLVKFLRREMEPAEKPELLLVYTITVVFFLAHTVFWALGLFNSGGILRVMVTITPLMALICYRGLEYLFAFIENNRLQKQLVLAVTVLLFLYPFSGHTFGYKWQRDFMPKADQHAQQEMAVWLQKNYPDHRSHTFYYEAVYLSEVLDIDWFNGQQTQRLLDAFVRNKFVPGDFIIWDDWFAVVEAHITLDALEKDPRLEKLNTFQSVNYWGVTRTTVVFRWK